jgi:diguanylate cyclase (GGDEF)-like protein/PAS domain S-box-containing protein
MDTYNDFTIGIYLFLFLSWLFISLFSLKEFILRDYSQKYFKILMLIIAIVALKSLFESLYFGLYFSSLYGMISKDIFHYLEKPELLALPKLFNALSAIIVLVYIYRGFLSEKMTAVESKITELEESHEKFDFLKLRTIKQNDLIELFQIINEIKHYVLQAQNREEILEFTCKKLSQYSHYKVVWIGIEQKGSSKIFADYYEDNASPPYLDTKFYVSSNPKDINSKGPVGKAFLQRMTHIVEDTQSDPYFGPWKKRAKKSGIKSVIAIPMFATRAEKTQGVVTIYVSDTHQYSFEEVNILEEIVQHIALASSLLESQESKEQNQQELLETKNLLENIITTIPARIFWKDLNLRYLGCNKLLMQDAQLSSVDDIIGKLDSNLVWSANAHEYNRDDLNVIESNKQIVNKVEQQGDRWLLTSKSPLKNIKGETIGVIGVSSDITFIQKAKEYLKNNEERFRSLLNQIPNIAIQGYDRNRIVTYWNKQSERLYGYTYDEVKGKRLEELIIPDEMVSYVKEAIYNWVEYGVPINAAEVKLKRKDGSLVDVFSSHVLLNELTDTPELFCMDIDLTAQKEAQDKLNHLANYDALTQLPNRHYMLKHLRATINKTDRLNEKFALMFLDLNGFKPINDTYGHQHGDDVLSTIAQRLKETIREYDFLARFGGDEFLLTIEYQRSKEQVESIAKKIITAIEKPIRIGEHTLQLGVSIGIACYPHDANTSEALIKSADASMYEAKKQAQSNYQFHL